jgi:hypothetical protein
MNFQQFCTHSREQNISWFYVYCRELYIEKIKMFNVIFKKKTKRLI